jgi:hypothetical protein
MMALASVGRPEYGAKMSLIYRFGKPELRFVHGGIPSPILVVTQF